MKTIILTEDHRCKCSCRKQNGDNGLVYWYDHRKEIVYSTDCHKPNPIKAIGTFSVNHKIINQS